MVNKFFVISAIFLPLIWAHATVCPHSTYDHVGIAVPSEWQLHNHTCHGQTEVYYIRSSPGKGLGVYARHDLEIGTVIMSETPALKITPPNFKKGTGYPMAAVSELLRAEYARLSREQQDEVMSLTYYGTAAEKHSSDPLGLIFRTNAYKSGDDIGLFPKIARINHSCQPNTSYYWNALLNKRVMYANRKIRKGEEILDSYISLLLPQEERQKLLKPYGFTCACDACAAGSRARKQSDERRMTIKNGFAKLSPHLTLEVPNTRQAKKQAVEYARLSARLAELVQQEGLADYYATSYRAAALSHARAEDWQAATVWANKGYEWRVMEDRSSSYAIEMHELTSRFIENWKADLRKKGSLKDGL